LSLRAKRSSLLVCEGIASSQKTLLAMTTIRKDDIVKVELFSQTLGYRKNVELVIKTSQYCYWLVQERKLALIPPPDHCASATSASFSPLAPALPHIADTSPSLPNLLAPGCRCIQQHTRPQSCQTFIHFRLDFSKRRLRCCLHSIIPLVISALNPFQPISISFLFIKPPSFSLIQSYLSFPENLCHPLC